MRFTRASRGRRGRIETSINCRTVVTAHRRGLQRRHPIACHRRGRLPGGRNACDSRAIQQCCNGNTVPCKTQTDAYTEVKEEMLQAVLARCRCSDPGKRQRAPRLGPSGMQFGPSCVGFSCDPTDNCKLLNQIANAASTNTSNRTGHFVLPPRRRFQFLRVPAVGS